MPFARHSRFVRVARRVTGRNVFRALQFVRHSRFVRVAQRVTDREAVRATVACSLAPALRGEGWGEGIYSLRLRTTNSRVNPHRMSSRKQGCGSRDGVCPAQPVYARRTMGYMYERRSRVAVQQGRSMPVA